jgi:hypothetical protein
MSEPNEPAVTFEIHPGIGVARVGTSNDFFVGPEPDGAPPDRYRDDNGDLLRQAVRFRVFRCVRDERNRLIDAQEVAPGQATINWTVHLANRKAAGEVFPPAPPDAPGGRRLRNPNEPDRARLIIDPGPRTISGPEQVARFDTGQFKGTVVPLGEIRCGSDGRLLVLGGFGRSGFVRDDGKPSPINDFANNSDWFDDVSDGPLQATVRLPDGVRHEAQPAWVVVAPPDFAPGITNFRTLYDMAHDVAVRRGWAEVSDKPSFTRDVFPILSRPMAYWWVSRLAGKGHGPGRSGDFSTMWSELADPDRDRSDREFVFARLRDPRGLPRSPFGMPRLHDDTFSGNVLPPTTTQFAVLQRWAAGDFVGDWGAAQEVVELLPDALDRAALQACSGGAFFPGIEAGRIMARDESYIGPYRLDPNILQPGAVTEGNAIPWQADFYACRLEAQSRLAWWPAQRPDQVFPDLDTVASLRSRDWDRGIDTFEGMVEHWHRLGVVAARPGTDGDTVFLETERTLPEV